jgi:hypothetical protein
MSVEKVKITVELLDDEDNVVSTDSVTDSYQAPEDNETGVCDLDFISASNGGPVMRPSKPRF